MKVLPFFIGGKLHGEGIKRDLWNKPFIQWASTKPVWTTYTEETAAHVPPKAETEVDNYVRRTFAAANCDTVAYWAHDSLDEQEAFEAFIQYLYTEALVVDVP